MSLAGLLEDLPAASRGPIGAAAETARDQGVALYLVGGFVRDRRLGRPSADLDLLVLGDERSFATRLAARLGAEVRSNREFGTATLTAPGAGGRLDVGRARSERYPRPGALPETQPGDLDEDLARRDFTVNALAIRVVPEPAGDWIDPHGGLPDLEAGLLQILHERSFEDDPTRILRGVELEQRLGFRFDAETERRALEAVSDGAFGWISADRLRRELFTALGRKESQSGTLARLSDLGLLAWLHPELRLRDPALDRLGRLLSVDAAAAARAPLSLCALAWDLSEASRQQIAGKLALRPREAELLVSGPGRVRQAISAADREGLAPHQASEVLAALGEEELALVEVLGGRTARAWARRQRSEFGKLVLAVQGRDLVDLGFEPGPGIGEALRSTRRARLDGTIDTEGELDFAATVLRRIRGLEP